jgi:senataxin
MADSTNFKNKIGIITFYRDQLRPLKKELFKYLDRDLADSININTDGGFPGQEKDVILPSCVRASGTLGFITDTRRMSYETLIILGKGVERTDT